MKSPSLVVARAETLMVSGAATEAVRMVSEAAQLGDADALYALALWRVSGEVVPRDFGLARVLFGRAGAAGHIVGALTHAVFVAMGAGGPADWSKAIAFFKTLPPEAHSVTAQGLLLADMKLRSDGAPHTIPSVEVLSTSPRVAIARALFTSDECAHIAQLAVPRMTPSVVVDPATGRQHAHPVRTSDGAVLGPVQQDLVVHALNRRIASLTGTQVEQGEPLAVMRYAPGQQYRLHHDCLSGERNQRIITVIVYLNEDFEGGATRFPELGLDFRARTGDAILFANVLPDGGADERSRHAGLPVTGGRKWICTRWIRRLPFDPWGAYH